MPDPENESELYALLANNANVIFLSNVTYHDPTSLRYVYQAVTEEDRWVVRISCTYIIGLGCSLHVTSKGFARYMTKYISKAEPSHIFNINESNRFYLAGD